MSSPTVVYNDVFAEKWIRDLSPTEWRGRVTAEFREIELSRLEHAGCLTDPDVVDGWMRTLQAGKPVPPAVAVETERGTYYLHDGNHRYQALKLFLGEDDGAKVRLAVAVPQPGFAFRHRSMGEYGTYLLEATPSPWAHAVGSATAVVTSSFALLLTALLPGVEASPFFVFLVLAVLVSGWVGGWKAGLLATLWSLSGAAYFLLPPNRSLLIHSREHAIQFALAGTVMVAVALFMQFVRRRPRPVSLPALRRKVAAQAATNTVKP